MNRNRRCIVLILVLPALGLVPAVGTCQIPKTVRPGQPLNITVTSATPNPDVSLSLGSRSAKVTPIRTGCTHTGGGNIEVQQPSPDTAIFFLNGVAVAYGGPTSQAEATLAFDLVQQFEVSFDKPTVKSAKLTIEGRLIGALRSHKLGAAEVCAGATIAGVTEERGLTLLMPSHAVSAGENTSINESEVPPGIVVGAGKFTLNQNFKVTATMPKCLLPSRAPSADFAQDGTLDPLWISPWEPFRGAKKAEFGFHVVIKVAPADVVPKADVPAKEDAPPKAMAPLK